MIALASSGESRFAMGAPHIHSLFPVGGARAVGLGVVPANPDHQNRLIAQRVKRRLFLRGPRGLRLARDGNEKHDIS
jgi:hypothetical protein